MASQPTSTCPNSNTKEPTHFDLASNELQKSSRSQIHSSILNQHFWPKSLIMKKISFTYTCLFPTKKIIMELRQTHTFAYINLHISLRKKLTYYMRVENL